MVRRNSDEPPAIEAEPELQLLDDTIHLMIDIRVYRLTAVKKTAYRVAARCTAVISGPDDHLLPVTLRFKPGTTETAAREAVRVFFQELLDQELREQIAEETSSIRTLILAHAFSKVDLIKRDP
jgi:His-Xaa-Ser system protein HxsD